MIVEQSLDLARSPATVFAFLVDQDEWARLDPTLLEVTPRAPVTQGMSGTMLRRVSGLPVTNGWTVTHLEPATRLGMRVTGMGYALTETTSLEATNGGTRATIVDILEPTSLPGKLFVALSGGFVRRDLHARAARLQAAIAGLPAD